MVTKLRKSGYVQYKKNSVVIPARTLKSAKNKARKEGFVAVTEGKQIKSKGTVRGLKLYRFPHK